MSKKYWEYNFNGIQVYRFEFSLINSNMYLICIANKALIIDPHFSGNLYALLSENNIEEITIFLTHEHPDHTSGVPYLADNYKTYLICQENCANTIKNEKNNRPILISFILSEKDKNENSNMLSKVSEYFEPYICEANLIFKNEFEYNWNNHKLKIIHTPGHSSGSACICLDNDFIFTGDSLFENLPIITRFKGGSKKEYIQATLPYLYTLPSNINVFPGHGEIFKLNKTILDNLKFN